MIAKSRARIEQLAHDPKPVYGVSTGFGALATRHIPHELRTQLQRSLIRSHAAGSGPEVEREVVRAMMLLRLSTLATGRTGVRPEVAQTYAAMLSAGLTPVVYEYGSLGCSGDLAPLAHVALSVIGDGSVRTADGELLPSAEALARHGIKPVVLAEKEGLALINGTDGMLGMLVLALRDLDRLLKLADVAASMSVEGLLGSDRVFAEDLQAMRPHPGQATAAANMRRVLAESPIVASHSGPDCSLVQDAYSLRCAPQVAGAARDTVEHARTVAGRELASAVDNPVVTLDGRVESNGNFHGAPVGYVLDFLAIAVADLASISERRTDRFLDVARSHGLNPFLAADPGVDSGHMIAQYTQAAIVSDLKRLANPGQCRLDPVVSDAGRPRLHGMVGGAQAAPGHRRADPSPGDRGVHRGTRYRDACPAGSIACHRGRHRRDPEIRPGARHRPVPVAGDRRRRRPGRLRGVGDGRRIGHRPVGLRACDASEHAPPVLFGAQFLDCEEKVLVAHGPGQFRGCRQPQFTPLEDRQTAALGADGDVAIVGCIRGISWVDVVIHGVLAERAPPCHNDVDIHLVHVRPITSVCKRLRRKDFLLLACETTPLDNQNRLGQRRIRACEPFELHRERSVCPNSESFAYVLVGFSASRISATALPIERANVRSSRSSKPVDARRKSPNRHQPSCSAIVCAAASRAPSSVECRARTLSSSSSIVGKRL